MRLELLRGHGPLSMLAAVVLAAVTIFYVAGASRAQGASSTQNSTVTQNLASLPPSDLGHELPGLRTESSDTYEGSNGLRVLRAYAHPLNYRDTAGNWQPIDDKLEQNSDGSWQTTASGVPVTLPSALGAGAVSIGSSGQSVSLQLQGASSTAVPTVAGATGSYAAVLPNTQAAYTVGPAAVHETLTLANADAPTVYNYALSLSSGLHASLTQVGTVDISDSTGKLIYRLAAPSVTESSAENWPQTAPAHYVLSADQKTLTLVLSERWLHDPHRAFPVKVDPDIDWWGSEMECTITSEADKNTSLCGKPLFVGSDSASPRDVSRTLLRFETSALPRDAKVVSGEMGLWLRTAGFSGEFVEEGYALSHGFTEEATWNTYDGSHSWSKAGGDMTGEPLPGGGEQRYLENTLVPSYAGYWAGPSLTGLAEKWASEPSSNHGFLLKAKYENTGEYAEYVPGSEEAGEVGGPDIGIVYTPVTGAQADATYNTTPIDDRANLSVNVADGNLLVANQDLDLPGVGYDLPLTNYYNSMSTYEAEEVFGFPEGGQTPGEAHALRGSIFSAGQDVTLEPVWPEEDRVYRDPSGAWWTFLRDPGADKEGNQAYLSPPGLNATLVVHESGAATLTYNSSQVKYEFNCHNQLEKIVDANGNTTSFEYDSDGRTSKITNPEGHALTFAYEGHEGRISKITDELSRHWRFAENSENELTMAEDPDGHELKYAYNTSHQLTQLTDPDGHLTELSYDSEGRISEIRRVVNGTATTTGSKDVITTYSYAVPAPEIDGCPAGSYGATSVVSPDGSPEGKVDSHTSGHTTTYCCNPEGQVTKTIDQAGNASTASYDLHGLGVLFASGAKLDPDAVLLEQTKRK